MKGEFAMICESCILDIKNNVIATRHEVQHIHKMMHVLLEELIIDPEKLAEATKKLNAITSEMKQTVKNNPIPQS